MRTITIRQLCLLAATVIGVLFITGCSTTSTVYRTYYQDRDCRIFYFDQYGNRVYEWRTTRVGFSKGVCYYRDANGRLYYKDSFGNRFYRQRVCW